MTTPEAVVLAPVFLVLFAFFVLGGAAALAGPRDPLPVPDRLLRVALGPFRSASGGDGTSDPDGARALTLTWGRWHRLNALLAFAIAALIEWGAASYMTVERTENAARASLTLELVLAAAWVIYVARLWRRRRRAT